MLPETLLLRLALAGLTLPAYGLARHLFLRYRTPLLQPVFVAAATIILTLAWLGLGWDEYGPVKEVLTWPLGPVTVALAVPIYNQRARFRAAVLPAACGVVLGSL